MAILQTLWNVGKVSGTIIIGGVKILGKGVIYDAKNIYKNDIVPGSKKLITTIGKVSQDLTVKANAMLEEQKRIALEQKVKEQVTEAPIPQNKEV